MIDRYLYKAKRTDSGEWVKGYYMPRPNLPEGERFYIIRPGSCVWNEVVPSTVCQYTGLHDRTKREELSEKEHLQFLSEWNYEKDRKNQKEDWNGKKIWENDIVREFAECDELGNNLYFCYQIIWDKEYCAFAGCDIRTKEIVKFSDLGEVEVITNVFDNPELLGGAD